MHPALTRNIPKITAVINLWLTMNLKQNVGSMRCFQMSVAYDRSLTGKPYNCQASKAMKQKIKVLPNTFKIIYLTVLL